MAGGEKISMQGGQGLGQNPFAALSGAGLPVAPKAVLDQAAAALAAKTSGGTAAWDKERRPHRRKIAGVWKFVVRPEGVGGKR